MATEINIIVKRNTHRALVGTVQIITTRKKVKAVFINRTKLEYSVSIQQTAIKKYRSWRYYKQSRFPQHARASIRHTNLEISEYSQIHYTT